jgi:hypothetical protein
MTSVYRVFWIGSMLTIVSFIGVRQTAPSGLQVTEKVAMLRAVGVPLKEGKVAGSWVVKSIDEGGKGAWTWP